MLDQSTSDFAVLRFAKFRTLSALGAASAHNTRTAKAGLAHTTPPPDGRGVLVLEGQSDAVTAWKDRADAVGLKKPRRDAVLAIEAVMSASPSWFDSATPEERDEWTERSLGYARDTFGTDNILQASLHLDEKTPHLHILAIPLEQKARAKAGRPRKGRKPAKRAATLSWGLNARDIIGTPDKLRDHQTNYAAALADLGLRRGRPKRATAAHHKSAAQYRVEAAEDRAKAAEKLASATDALEEASDTLTTATAVSRNTIERAKSKERWAERTQKRADARADAFSLGLDAVEQGELVPRPTSKSLKRIKVEKPVLPPQESSAFGAWTVGVRPYIKALWGYAKRLAGLAERERQLKEREAQLDQEAAALKRIAEREAIREAAAAKERQDRPAYKDLNTLSNRLSRKKDKSAEFADPPDRYSPSIDEMSRRERQRQRERER